MNDDFRELRRRSTEIRRLLAQSVAGIGVGHLGGSLSVVDVLVYLYERRLRVNPERPDWPDRDRLVLSKGHAGPALYAVLAAKGYFPRETLSTLNRPGTVLPSHCDMRRTPGVDMTAGSLGQGLSAALGMALAARMDGKDYYVFCLVGDGELQEGQIWEAIMYAASRKAGNLTLIVDDNGMQVDDYTAKINDVRPIAPRLSAFGWAVREANGHDFAEMDAVLGRGEDEENRPRAVVLRTIKGRGISCAEGRVESHNMAFGAAELEQSLRELDAAAQEAERL